MNTVHLEAAFTPDLDRILKAHREPTRFVLGPGFYHTSGAAAFDDLDWCMLAPGCELIGAGSGKTVIALWDRETSSPLSSPYREILTGGSRSGSSPSVRVSGITIDATSMLPSVGLHLWSTRAFVRDVHVVNLWGDWTQGTGWEAFGILVNNGGQSAGGIDGGCQIENCHVEAAPLGPDEAETNYVCAVYLGTRLRPGASLLPSTVYLCSASYAGRKAHCAFGINSRTTIQGSSASGFDRAVFSDTGEGVDSLIRNCFLDARYAAIDLKGGVTGWDRRNIAVTDCDLILTGTPDADHVAGMVLADTSGSRDAVLFDHVRLERCRLENRSNAKGYLGSLDALRASRNGLIECSVRGQWSDAVLTPHVPPSGWVQTIDGRLA